MYLSSTDIKRYLEEGNLKIIGTDQYPFDPAKQIRPCSVDVRISNEFWKFKGAISHIDLLDIDKIKEDPNILYHKITLSEGQFLELRPGEILITHILEWIELPTFLAGKIEGRSSFARLGISVHCTGDFINPGYKGHMAVQLVNHNVFPVRIYPFISMAQLIFIVVSSEPDVHYQKLPNTVYRMDYGGPSLWFRDKEIQELAVRIGVQRFNRSLELLIKDELEKSEKRTLREIERYLRKAKTLEPDQLEKAMEEFEAKEVKRIRKMAIAFWIASMVLGADIGVLIPEIYKSINTGNVQSLELWLSFTILIFLLVIIWLTFDIRFIFDPKSSLSGRLD